MRAEHEYDRAGALALLAVLDVHTGKVPAAAPPPTTGNAEFKDGMGQVMVPEPYPAPRACSSSWTTAPITAARQPSAGWPKPGRTPS